MSVNRSALCFVSRLVGAIVDNKMDGTRFSFGDLTVVGPSWSLPALLTLCGIFAGCSGTPSTTCQSGNAAGAAGADPCATGGSSATGGASGGAMSTGGKSGGGAPVTGGWSAGVSSNTGGAASGGAPGAGGTTGVANTGGAGGTSSTGGAASGGAPATGGTIAGGASSSGGSGGATNTGGSASSCVSDTESAHLGSVNLIILLDKSGSMGNDPNGLWSNATTRWNPVVQTLDAFVSDPGSNRLNAALILIPSDGSIQTACAATSYESGTSAIKIPLTLLDPAGRQLFLSRLCDPAAPQNPPCIVPAGGTPTRPAVQGAIDYANAATQSNPNSKSVIVFLTDGEPGFGYLIGTVVTGLYSCDDLTNGCATSSATCTGADQEVANVAAVIQSAPAKSVYVVGAGDLSTTTMNRWATASGNPAISLVSLTPALAAATLRAALNGIRTNSVSCSFAIPQPSGSASIDYTELNVSYQAGNGSSQDLRRTSNGTSATCSGTSLGWYYDNPAAPKTINLCPSTCSALQQDAGAKLQVVFGCDTQTF